MRRSRGAAAIALAAAFLALAPAPGTATAALTEEERSFLALYFDAEELAVLSATRSLKAVASVAENVAVVSAEEIALANVHTVAEALAHVTGVELLDFRGPGVSTSVAIHGSGRSRVTVLLDGVPLDSASNDFQLGTLAVQMIRRIEVLKGPASSAWGSSFGGVVNVITKSVEPGEGSGGTLAASAGTGRTTDLRAEARVATERLGLYVSGGRMASDGLPGANRFENENLFAKVSARGWGTSRIGLSLFARRGDALAVDLRPAGRDVYNGFNLDTLVGRGEVRAPLADGIDFSLAGWWELQRDNFYERRWVTDESQREGKVRYERRGASGSLSWRSGSHALVAGVDASEGTFERRYEPFRSIDQGKTALYVNDTITAGRVSVTPGLRHDHSSLTGDFLSPSLGLTHLASRDLLVRAIVSRGFHDPALVRHFDAPAVGYVADPDLGPERIWSYQAGLEANLADLLRARLTLFRHDIAGILVERRLGGRSFTLENGGSARTAGGELELVTNAHRGFVLRGGVHHERTRLLDFHDPLVADASDVTGVTAAVSYDRGAGLAATLNARYLRLDMTEPWKADSAGVVVDLSVTRSLPLARAARLEAFAAARNLLDADSYGDALQRNPGRWFEAGARCVF